MILTIIEIVWFIAIVVLTVLSGELNSGVGFIAAIMGLGLHYLTNKGNPFFMNLYPMGAGFRKLIAEMILSLVLLNILLGYSQNWSLLILTALYIPFEYFVED